MGELQTTDNKVEAMQGLLTRYQPELEKLLPPYIKSDRFIRVALNAINKLPRLLDCTKSSFILAHLECAALHLEPNVLGMSFILPYKNNSTGNYDAQLIVGYKGYIQLGRRSGQIDSWIAGCIKAGDYFEYTDFPPDLKHKRNPESDERGEIVAAYSGVRLFGGDWQPHVMFKPEIDKRMKKSASYTSQYSPWKLWPEEMNMKTAVRDHFKFMPLALDTQQINRANELDTRADIGATQFHDSEFQELIEKETGVFEAEKEEKGKEK